MLTLQRFFRKFFTTKKPKAEEKMKDSQKVTFLYTDEENRLFKQYKSEGRLEEWWNEVFPNVKTSVQ